MTKAEIARRVAGKCGCSKKSALAAVQETLDTVKDSILQKQRIHLRGFGAFVIFSRRAGIRRNPKTGERLGVPAKKYLHFKPAHPLIATINQ